MAVKMWTVVFWVVTPCSLVSGYECTSKILVGLHDVTTQKITN
jgi:hypothetical protein